MFLIERLNSKKIKRMRIILEKTKHHKHGSEDKIKNHKNLDKRVKKKIEIKRRRTKLKKLYMTN
jgi:hypothetical protein